MRYDFTDLRLFLAIADASNLSRGAEACHLSPSSASLRLRRLETRVGTALFKREARGVKLTRAGQIMREHTRRCFAQLEQMNADLAPFINGVKGELTIFANSNAIASFLPDDMQVFLKRHEGLRVRLEEHLSHDTVAAVAEGRADLGIVAWEGEHPALSFHKYREDELVVVSSKAMNIRPGSWISFQACLEYPFVCLQTGAAIHTFILSQAAALGRCLDVRIQVCSFPAVIALIRAGAGIGIVPRSVMDFCDTSDIQLLRLKEEWAIRNLRICVASDPDRTRPHVNALLEHLKTCASEHHGFGTGDSMPGDCVSQVVQIGDRV